MISVGGVILVLLIIVMSILTKRQLDKLILEEQRRLVQENPEGTAVAYGTVVRE